MRNAAAIVALLIGVLTSGCQKNLYFATGTQFGLELNALEGGRQAVKLGFQREEGVVMPLRRDKAKNETLSNTLREAYPVLSIYDMDTGSLGLSALSATTVRQVFATGKAAVSGKSLESVAETMSAMKGHPIPFQTAETPEERALETAYKVWIAKPENTEAMKEWLKKEGIEKAPANLIGSGESETLGRANKRFGFYVTPGS